MSWQLFDRLAAFFKSANIYRSENILQDQSSLARISAGGEFLNFSSQYSLLDQTNLQINRLERLKDYDQMDQVGEISASLDMFGDYGSLSDPELHHSLLIKARSLRIKKELENLFYNTLMIDNILRPMIRYLCKHGDFPAEIVPTQNRTGIASIRHMNVYNFSRVETKYGDLVGFFYHDEMASQPTFFHPWQILHLRLTSYENLFQPYGKSLLEPARKHFKQLRLMEDAALIYRLSRAASKLVFSIPVGNIPAKEVPQYIQLIAREFKKKKFFDPASGDVSERYSPLIQDDYIWLPKRPDGSGPEVDALPGAENLDQIADIEYFKKKMVSALKIPFSRVGIGEPSEGDSEPLSKVAPEFAKSVQWIQREVATGLKKLAIIHLALRGYAADDIRDFDLHMTASSAIDELYRIETWASRADVIDSLKGTELFPDKWILQRFSNMTDDEIKQMKDEADKEKTKAGVIPTAEEELEALPIEGYDYEKEKQVIIEAAKLTGTIVEETHNSSFDHLLNKYELDGLVNEDGIQLIGIGITEELVKAAKKDAMLLLEQNNNISIISEEITNSDLPE